MIEKSDVLNEIMENVAKNFGSSIQEVIQKRYLLQKNEEIEDIWCYVVMSISELIIENKIQLAEKDN